MITSKNLTFSYDKNTSIIANLDLAIPPGKFSLLIGPTGCGKSTLLKILAGLYPKYAGHLSGTINLNGLTAAMMFQNAGEQFTMSTPREEIIFTLENLQVDAGHYAQRLEQAVQFAQIDDLLDQKINTMSGGEQQRVALAVLVAMEIDVFLLDEPFASCDPATRSHLLTKLAHLRDLGKTIILSDHVLTGYANLVDLVFHFQDRGTVRLSEKEKMQLLTPPKNRTSYSFTLPGKEEPACFVLKQASIKQNRLLLTQDYLPIVAGKTTLITGANGVGKTSLFNALTKMIPYAGSITYRHQEVKQQAARKYLTQVGQIFQTASDQFINITVKDELELSKKQGTTTFFTKPRITAALVTLGLDRSLDRVVYSLSGGQQKKLQILLMLLADHDVLLLDEPLSGLDANSVKQTMQLVRDTQQARGQTLLIISHELTGLAEWCDYHLVLADQHLTYVCN